MANSSCFFDDLYEKPENIMQMRKFFLFFFCSFSLAFAQNGITIDATDMPFPATSHTISTAISADQYDLSLTGENYQWDFSQLSAITQRQDSFTDLDNLNIVYSFEYPFSNVVRIVSAVDSFLGFQIDESYQFYRNAPSAFEDQGFIFEVDFLFTSLVLRRNPPDTIFTFPLTYGMEDSGYSEITVEFPSFGVFYEQRQSRKTTVDGWGTLTTPYGTHEVLRVRADISRQDTAYLGLIGDTTINFITNYTEYKWLGKGQGVPLIEANVFSTTDTTGLLDSVLLTNLMYYKDSLRDVSVSNQRNIEPIEATVYPNPTSESIQLEWDRKVGQEGKLEIMNLNGQRLFVEEKYRGGIPVPIQSFPTGSYIVRLTVGNKSYNGKIIVNKR